MNYPELAPVRCLASRASRSGLLGGYATKYVQCRLEGEFGVYLYRSALMAVAVAVLAMAVVGAWLLLRSHAGETNTWTDVTFPVAAGLAIAAAIFYLRLYSVSSLRDYR